MTTKDPNKKPTSILRVVKDEAPCAGHDQSTAESPSALTPKLLDEYVAKLVQFERDALVGQESGIQPTTLADLASWARPGARSPIRIKKQGEPSTIGTQPAPAFLPDRKGS